MAAREAFSAPLRAYETKGRGYFLEKDHREKSTGRNGQEMLGRREERYRTEYTQRDEKEDSSDLRTRIASKRNRMAKNVWNRLDQHSGKSLRDNDRFHPYHIDPRDVSRNIRRGSESFNTRTQYSKSDSSSSCRVKGSSPEKYDRFRDQVYEKRRSQPLDQTGNPLIHKEQYQRCIDTIGMVTRYGGKRFKPDTSQDKSGSRPDLQRRGMVEKLGQAMNFIWRDHWKAKQRRKGFAG